MKNEDYNKFLLTGGRAVPGQSLTGDPDNPRPFERAPRFVSIHEAFEYIFANALEEKSYLQFMGLLGEGVPVMTITQNVLFYGFYEGLWNPDLMLLLGEPVAYMFLALAERAGIEAKIYDGEEDDDLDDDEPFDTQGDAETLNYLKQRSKSFKSMPGAIKLSPALEDKLEELPELQEKLETEPEESLLAPKTTPVEEEVVQDARS